MSSPQPFKPSMQPASDFDKLPPEQILVCHRLLGGMYTAVSDSIYDFGGYRPSELIGRSAYDFFHPDDVEAITSLHQRAALLEGTTQSMIYRFRCKDGSYKVFETIIDTRRDSNDLPVELITHSRVVG